MKLNGGSIGIGQRGGDVFGAGNAYSPSPAPVASSFPVVTGYSGTGGGSFNVAYNERCPTGYNTIFRAQQGTHGFNQCIPKPQPIYRPVAPAPAPAPVFTVSPTFQQQFTPQFSPTLQQQQDSPGASQAAQPQQEIATPQQATTGTSPALPSGPSTSELALRAENELLRYNALIRAQTPVPTVPLLTETETYISTPAPVSSVVTSELPSGMPNSLPTVGVEPRVEAYIETGPNYAPVEKDINFVPWLIGGALLLMMG